MDRFSSIRREESMGDFKYIYKIFGSGNMEDG